MSETNCNNRLVRSHAVQRCKTLEGDDMHKRIHATDDKIHETLCGLELNEMWFMHSLAILDGSDATCPKCRKIMPSNTEDRRERSEFS